MELKVGRELNELIAERIMLWTRAGEGFDDWVYKAGHGKYRSTIFHLRYKPFEPSNNSSDAFEMEEKIKERGRGAHYAQLLFREILPYAQGYSYEHLFAVAHASPLDRCRAALKTIESS